MAFETADASQAARRNPRIVVADDEPHIVCFIEYNLGLSGFDVVPAYSGQDALDRIEECAPDAVILDINMPGLDGIDTLRRIRENPALERLIVIIFSARVLDSLPGDIEGLHPDLVLRKPVAPTRLVEALETMLAARDEDEPRAAGGRAPRPKQA